MNNRIKVEPFLYRNIIKEKSENIIFEINKPKFEKNVLNLDREYEKTNGYFTIINVNNEYKLYYRACPYPTYKDIIKKEWYSTQELAEHEYFCLAISNDGLNFERHNYNLINYNNIENNILFHDLFCHNFYPFYDKKNNKYIGISGTALYNNGLHLFESTNGINWIHIKQILDETHILPGWAHINHFDTHNCIVYNENDENYYIYIRNNKLIDNQSHRFVQYTKTKNFDEFINCTNINIFNNNNLTLYTPGIFQYPNSDYYIGIPSVQGNNYEDKNNAMLMVSLNNTDFEILTKDLFQDNNNNSMNINSIVPSIDNKKLYIYTHNNFGNIDDYQYITCHSFEINRINKIICNDYGFIKTELIKISNKITVNYDTFNEGYFTVKLFNTNNECVYDTINYYNSSYDLDIIWNNNSIINTDNYYVQFNMYNCILYSFSYEY